MKTKNYFAPGVIEHYPCRRRLSADAVQDALLLAVSVAMTIGLAIGGML